MLPSTMICDTEIGRFLLFRTRETITNSLVTHGDFEPLARKILGSLFPENDAVVIDAGANIGTFTIPVAMTNPKGSVYSFEPQRTIYYQLCANTILNSLANVFATHAAIGNPSSDKETIEVPIVDIEASRNLGAVSLIPEIREKMIEKKKFTISNTERVRLTSVDSFLSTIDKRIDFIKIDVEGMELDVLIGARETLSKHNPAIFFESWSSAPEERRKIENFLTKIGYSVQFIGEDALALPNVPLRSGKIVSVANNTLRIT